MRFDQLYEESIELWPGEIDISDGKILDNGILFVNLSTIWDDIENKSKSMNEWFDLMAWVIFANFHSIAKREYQAGKNNVNKNQIDREKVKDKLFKNLYEEGYQDMLIEFKRDNPH